MGTDIHMAIEVRRAGKWCWVPGAIPCMDCNGTKRVKFGDRAEEDCYCVRYAHRGRHEGRMHGYHDRNYDAFGIIANVRNGTCGEETPFISEARGLPDDISAELKAANEAPYELPDGNDNPAHFSLGDHSFTSVTLAELLAFNWDDRGGREATINADQYAKWDKKSALDSYCAWSSGETVSMSEADERITAGKSEGYNVRAKWGESLAEMAGNFHSKFIPELVAISEREGVPATDVRIVFGFDS